MRIAVLGAGGATGRHVVDAALRAGHQVTGVVRRPDALDATRPGLRVVCADVQDGTARLESAVEADAVVSALGVRHGYRGPTSLYSVGIGRNVVGAMRTAGVRRLVFATSSGVDYDPAARLPFRLLVGAIVTYGMPHMYADMARLEERLRDTDLDWTAVRAPRLGGGPAKGDYVSSVNEHLGRSAGGRALSRADLAEFLLRSVSDPATHRSWVEVAPPAARR